MSQLSTLPYRRFWPMPSPPRPASPPALLRSHVVSVHDRRRDFSCQHCPRTFSTNSDRLSHTRAVHLNARPHECRICMKSFNRKAHLRAHMSRVHKHGVLPASVSEL